MVAKPDRRRVLIYSKSMTVMWEVKRLRARLAMPMALAVLTVLTVLTRERHKRVARAAQEWSGRPGLRDSPRQFAVTTFGAKYFPCRCPAGGAQTLETDVRFKSII